MIVGRVICLSYMAWKCVALRATTSMRPQIGGSSQLPPNKIQTDSNTATLFNSITKGLGLPPFSCFFTNFRVTGVFPLEEAPAALECARQKGALKVQIICS